MPTCVLVAKLIQCTMMSGTQMSPAEAARILIPNQFVLPKVPDGPKFVIFFGSPNEGPFGTFPELPVTIPLNCCGFYQTYLGRGNHSVPTVNGTRVNPVLPAVRRDR